MPPSAQDPESAAYLSECIALMRQHHIEYIHRADQEIRQRMAALGQEVPAHRAAMTELQQVCVALRDCRLLRDGEVFVGGWAGGGYREAHAVF